MAVHVGILVDRVAVYQVFLQVHCFPLSVIRPVLQLIQGTSLATVPRDSVIPHRISKIEQ